MKPIKAYILVEDRTGRVLGTPPFMNVYTNKTFAKNSGVPHHTVKEVEIIVK